jgi:hypothetical protein
MHKGPVEKTNISGNPSLIATPCGTVWRVREPDRGLRPIQDMGGTDERVFEFTRVFAGLTIIYYS